MNKTLQTLSRRHIAFDPANAEHRAAYRQLRTVGTQDPELRFLLEAPFSNVLSMMQAKLADHFSVAPAPVPPEVAQLPARKREQR